MNKKILFFFVSALVAASAPAHDLEVANNDGVTIYYSKLSDTEVAVTFKGAESTTYVGEYKGEITIPSTIEYAESTYDVTSIGAEAFSNCPNLTGVNLPETITTIGAGAFWKCTKLVSITLPKSVTYVDQLAFEGCSALKEARLPYTITYLGQGAFNECKSLTTVTIPEGIDTLYDFTFAYCTSLKDIEIPDNVTALNDCLFYGCSGLQTIYFPRSVKYIGFGVVYECTSLKSLKVNVNNPADITIGDFNFVYQPASSILYVPQGSKALYAAAYPWNYFKNIEEFEPETQSAEIIASDQMQDNACYDLTGRRVENPTRGIYIRGGQKIYIK